jgi:Amt family ammonium transporter
VGRAFLQVIPVVLALASAPALAADAKALDPAATAWVLTATALVLFMTLPGLALFYAGLVHARNVLSVLMHCAAIACLVSAAWFVAGYGLAFGDGSTTGGLVGLGHWFLTGIGVDTLKGELPASVHVAFQMTFAIITPALIVGAYAERIRFGAVALYSVLWVLIVYAPVCHWIWGEGWLAANGVMDFAGGIVVHATAGAAALVAAVMLKPRRGFPHEMPLPHNPGITVAGAGMLWVGWFGFNGGSALAAGGGAGMALLVTHLSAAFAGLTWMAIEWSKHGKASSVGLATGVIAGLATVTPAAGYIGAWAALPIGVAAGAICFRMTSVVKRVLGIDDSLDVFAVHGVGGALGTLLTAVFALPSLGGIGYTIADRGFGEQLGWQAMGLLAGGLWSALATWIIFKLCGAFLGGIRVGAEQEAEGLDVTAHGERGYDLKL